MEIYKIRRQFSVGQNQLTVLFMCLFLTACSEKVVKDSAPSAKSVDIDTIPDAVPRAEPKSKYGNPKSYEVFGKRYYVMDSGKNFVEKGIASWYGKKFHGRRTSNGETYDMYAMTAAHKTLPLPAYVEVRNLKNNKKIIVRVNDRGPFHDNRIIDLSYTAARKLDIVANGTGLVEIRTIVAGDYGKKQKNEEPGAPVLTAITAEPVSGFYIQVGAFRDESNARRLQVDIAAVGRDLVKVRQANVNGNAIHRVQIGPLFDVDEADRIVRQLEDHGISEHHIVVEP